MDHRGSRAHVVDTVSYLLVSSSVQFRADGLVGFRRRGAGGLEARGRRRSVHVEAVVFVAYGLVSAARGQEPYGAV